METKGWLEWLIACAATQHLAVKNGLSVCQIAFSVVRVFG